jgi:endo-1,4-beta-mannosidase
VYFQYGNGTRPAVNDGADGLARLDYEVFKARQDGVRLVVPLTNNWTDFGGMDQHVRWARLGWAGLGWAGPPRRLIDYLSYHLYPEGWGKDAAWGAK